MFCFSVFNVKEQLKLLERQETGKRILKVERVQAVSRQLKIITVLHNESAYDRVGKKNSI